MRVIFEAVDSDNIGIFLMSSELIDLIKHYTDPKVINRHIIEECAIRFPDDKLPILKTVNVYKVNKDSTVDILSSEHQVLEYDGYYYDYNAKEFDQNFQESLQNIVPCVQRIITNKDALTRFDSNIKGYSMVG